MPENNDDKSQKEQSVNADLPEDYNQLDEQPCPFCGQSKLTLREFSRDIPFFGKVFVFSMTCSNCKYHKSDVEPAEENEPSKYTLDVTSEEDMSIRIVKSSNAIVKIPRITTISPGPESTGYITNVEGLLNRVKKIVEEVRDEADDNAEKKKAKNMIKKIQNIMWGRESIKITIEDPTGCSAIISDKAIKQKIKG
jgi:zinc finger protein